MGGAGYRSDLEDVTSLIRDGAPLAQIAAENLSTYIKYSRGIKSALAILRAPHSMERYVHILHGPTGTGKTRSVWERHGAEVFSFGDIKDWFDGYGGESVILCDEVTYDAVTNTLNGLPIRWWNKFLDRYPMRLQVKGGSCLHQAKAIYLTTNQDPRRDWWTCLPLGESAAFWRRVTTIKPF